MPALSVIVPNYNHSMFLKKRIDSILTQTYKDFEIIILDDCSSDNSRAIIEHYRTNPHVSHIIFNETNSGSPFIQWQRGINLAKGEFIWIAESDDYAENTFLSEVFKRFNSDDKIGAVYCDSHVINGETIAYDFYKNHRNNMFNTNYWNNDYVVEGKHEINNYLILECTINNTSTLVFKKNVIKQQVFKELGLFKYSGDWYFFLTLINNCKLSYIRDALNFNRKGVDNFKEGVRSKENYFKERCIVRFLYSKKVFFDDFTLKKIVEDLSSEMKTMLVYLLQTQNSLHSFYDNCNLLKAINQDLFRRILSEDQLLTAVNSELMRIYETGSDIITADS
ncbi:MAG TPA: glycosyltransferase family 2 protein [Mucilaginibacter sp.]|jgi:glycosyltransferase involved in cell wall biosynthesis|nr:glycosyltransferase family 2 protein [Mucilaginibacter sp.]